MASFVYRALITKKDLPHIIMLCEHLRKTKVLIDNLINFCRYANKAERTKADSVD